MTCTVCDELGYPMNPEGAFQPRGGKVSSMRFHGWLGGGSAPPPDPALVASQIRSMSIQDDAIQQTLRNANDIAPLQKQQLQDSITRGDALYSQSQEDRTYGLQRRGVLTGLQDQLVTDAQTYSSKDRQEQMAGEAQADVTSAYGNSAEQLGRGLERTGVNVNSGKFVTLQNQNSLAQAAASASAANKTRTAARLEGFQLTDRATNAFSGYPSQTASSVGAGLSTAGFGLNSANAGLAGLNSGYGQVGQMAGAMGANATGMFGAQANYKSSQDQIAEQSDPMSTVFGVATGFGASALTNYLNKPKAAA